MNDLRKVLQGGAVSTVSWHNIVKSMGRTELVDALKEFDQFKPGEWFLSTDEMRTKLINFVTSRL